MPQDRAQGSHRDSAADVRDFFTPRAADWDSRFPDDGPAYAAAVADLGLRPGDRCWTRAAARAAPCPRCAPRWGPRGPCWASTSRPPCWRPPDKPGGTGTGRSLLADVAAAAAARRLCSTPCSPPG